MTKSFTPLPGIPPNMSIMAAISAGLLPANTQITNFGTGPNTNVLTDLSTGDAPGNGLVPSDVFGNQAASTLTTATPPNYGGD